MTHDIDASIVDAAIAWSVRLQFNRADPGQTAAFERWRAERPEHEAAWQRVNSLDEPFGKLPSKLALETLDEAARRNRSRGPRRKALKALGWFGVAGLAGWFAHDSAPWQRATADYASATGERKTVRLIDGTTLVLNTDTALNVRFDDMRRVIDLLRGEIYVQTGQDSGAVARRPFYVQTGFARLQALGTRFAVRLDTQNARVSVDEGAVEIAPPDGVRAVAHAGDVYRFDRTRAYRIEASLAEATGWLDGVIVAHQMPLVQFLAELSRYRPGVLRCDPAIAALPVSGAFQTADTERTLAFLADNLHLSVTSRTRYWVTLHAAGTS
ncbi:FecR domain-containing protein [Paraburkholderia metrosideri]|uniref:FecR domain-containing protein n=1 Tax=Paraburkholderia metrosideri TaxID=580937 RepID=A0ABW9DN91_9BURK